ncbi:PKD domain-containing protein [Pseudarthrobacter sp. J1763]|uniref:PKD domain-containing protein n=1 Tax=Pseudarthrobacter sp. J1763 TaxID=3420445 RepID=UPI003D28C26F
MKRRSISLVLVLLLVWPTLGVVLADVANATDSYTGGFGDGTTQATASRLIYDEKAGKFSWAPAGVTDDDPNQYTYLIQCQDERDADGVGCVPMQCPKRPGDKEPGVPVNWKYAPKAIPNPTWTDWKPVGDRAVCLYDPRPEDILPLIAKRILKEFQALPIKAGTATVQPAPHTLKGAETNIYAEASKQDFNITLLGQSVHLTATPVEYTYNYGDGSTLGPTPVSGGPLPEDEWGTKTRTSHVYTATGNYPVSVTTSFTGTYSVNGGPPLPIDVRASVGSAPQTIQVWRSITKNYADNCIQNPHGEGC